MSDEKRMDEVNTQQDLEKVDVIMRENNCSRIAAEFALKKCSDALSPDIKSIELVVNKIDMMMRETKCTRLEAEMALNNGDDGKIKAILHERAIQQVMTEMKCSRSEAEKILETDEKDIELVKAESGCTWLQAEEALTKCGWDITKAILSFDTVNFDSKDV
ncbi:predicted protein [Chaetoceros tenuissimus]|uniref:Uncharacterized protein n=1 Tax=Chaetoceros tenuissimus TaxID=426638 RepID=A0AAD3DFK5_9STRA|nr:predicted protein [Chaetoceros tenuissimus]